MYADYSKIIKFDTLPDPTDTWELVDKIGEGTYGEVHSAKNKHTGHVVAIKILETLHEVVEEIEEEYQVLRDLSNHPNLPLFYGLYLKQDPQADDQLWIAMELCSGGSVTDLVKAQLARNHTMDELLIAHILKECMKALKHLHQNHIIHRDVKGHNLLLTSDAQIKLIDFGVSGHLKETLARRNTSVGTPFWMAPEVIACEQQLEYDYDIRCDVWSLGVTAIELADGEPPFADHHPMRALFKIPRSPPPTVRDPSSWSKEFMNFIDRCVIKDFEKRPFLTDLFNHPFITQVPNDTSKLQAQLKEMLIDLDEELHEPYVTTKHGQLRSKHKAKKEPLSAVDDLATLDNLEEEIIVDHLCKRYNKNVMYTYIGDILLAVNPFCPLKIYDEEHSKMYRNVDRADLPPHIFVIADQSYHMMMHNKYSQCIVISGESGAGKTESANLLVQQLTLLGRAANRTLEDRILQVNPLVEAFGNAMTVINDNSSRFGKYLEMTFTSNGKVTGARLSEYLLERSRVIRQAHGERNFHIFYYIHDGLRQDDKLGKYHLNSQSAYQYLSGHNAQYFDSTTTSTNRSKFKTIQRCFETIGFKTQEIAAIYSILVAILHIGNVMFVESEGKHQTLSRVQNIDLIDIVSDLLGIDGKELQEALTTSGMVARGETIIKNNSINEAINIRDALAKALYGRLFGWIVNKINTLLKPARNSKLPENDCLAIGILDIFGFENFEQNSFEQLCINIANEQIQYYFNQHIFAWELQEYKNEGISADIIEFVDNRPVLDMFLAKPVGLLALLDEESNFPQASDYTLVEKFQRNIQCPYFKRPKSQALKFTVLHYAGKVEYDSSGFLEKNRDRLASEIISVLRLSQIALVRTLFNSPMTKTGNLAYSTLSSTGMSIYSSPVSSLGSSVSVRSTSNILSAFDMDTWSKSNTLNKSDVSTASQSRLQQTVATYFRYSLMDLLSKMVTGSPHFIRCIRPNTENSPGYFDKEKVLRQLRYTGVLETTRIRRQGYSHRITFSEFLKRYYILGFSYNEKVRVNRESCHILLDKIGLENWVIGRTKVFLKYYHIEQLSRKFEKYQHRVIIVQSVVRRWLCQRQYHRMVAKSNKGAIVIQKVFRGWIVCRKHRDMMKKRHLAAVSIQKVVRGFLARRRYLPLFEKQHNAVITIQAWIRGYLQQKRFLKYKEKAEKGVVKIQSAYRGYNTRKQLLLDHTRSDEQQHRAAIILQKYFRMWKAQLDYVKRQLDRRPLHSQVISICQQDEEIDDVYYNPKRHSPSHFAVSPERYEHLQKAANVKTPWREQDIGYYDMLRETDGRDLCTKRQERLKQLNSAEGQKYYDNLVAEIQHKLGIKPKHRPPHFLTSGNAACRISPASPPTSNSVTDFEKKLPTSATRWQWRSDLNHTPDPLEPNGMSQSEGPTVQFFINKGSDVIYLPEKCQSQNALKPQSVCNSPTSGNKANVSAAPLIKFVSQSRNSAQVQNDTTNQSQPKVQMCGFPKKQPDAKFRNELCYQWQMQNDAHLNHSSLISTPDSFELQNGSDGHSSGSLIKHDSGVYDTGTSGGRNSQHSQRSSSAVSQSTLTSYDVSKCDSMYSLTWDDALEKARQRALAPDLIQSEGHVQDEISSVAGTGTPSCLDSDTDLQDDNSECHESSTESLYIVGQSNGYPRQSSAHSTNDTFYEVENDSIYYETPGSWYYESFNPGNSKPNRPIPTATIGDHGVPAASHVCDYMNCQHLLKQMATESTPLHVKYNLPLSDYATLPKDDAQPDISADFCNCHACQYSNYIHNVYGQNKSATKAERVPLNSQCEDENRQSDEQGGGRKSRCPEPPPRSNNNTGYFFHSMKESKKFEECYIYSTWANSSTEPTRQQSGSTEEAASCVPSHCSGNPKARDCHKMNDQCEDASDYEYLLKNQSLPTIDYDLVLNEVSNKRRRYLPPWKWFYPPTPPRLPAAFIKIPNPPAEPPPLPPIREGICMAMTSSPPGDDDAKRVHFSEYDEIILRTPSLIGSFDNDEEHSSEIHWIRGVSDEEAAYDEELIEEQRRLRETLTQNRQTQETSEPFDDKDSGDEDSDDNDNDDGDSDKEGAYKRILSPPRDYDKGISLGSSVTQSTPLDPERPVSRLKIDKNIVDVIPQSTSSELSESDQGTYNFRALLRKTNRDMSKTLRKQHTEEEDSHKVDFRSVLKKRNLTQIIAN
ncbi:hypothetical protein LSH36_4g17098 [Paralvinella palmiformis]|uniref:non-specific serine/threonine protein kinase n=1 Tax=Paralvinella palmiformis TaxID=53620 RepID=A0AAD9KFD5_9ANNE|nr:hypothetical protein LSH36_4g17098 [Paralvinella palmiformis]